MPVITFQGEQYECSQETPLLDSLHAHGLNLPAGCRGGMCQACMLKAVAGQPPETSQSGISPKLKNKNYFLPCVCRPKTNLEITLPDRRDELNHTEVCSKDRLTGRVIRLRLNKPDGFSYRPGQFINLMRAEDNLVRSYSLASINDESFLELHIKPVVNGRLSNWIADDLARGDEILFSDAMGTCCYQSSIASEQPLLLAGTGTGLAPLYGILRDALASGHQQPICLLHGGINRDGLYYHEQLLELARQYELFTYLPCVLDGKAPSGGYQGNITELLEIALKRADDWSVYLCGDSQSVDGMRKTCLADGINESAIHTDAFG